MPLAFDAVTFQNEELEGFLRKFEELAAKRAEATNQTANFHAVLFQLAKLFPEDQTAIFGLYAVPAVERSTGTKAAPARINKSVFGKPSKTGAPCATCPDAQKVTAGAMPGINTAKREAVPELAEVESRGIDEAEAAGGLSSLPAELLTPAPAPPKRIETLNDVETMEDLKAFLRTSEREPNEVILELKSLMAALGIEYPGTMKKLDSFLNLFFEKVVQTGGRGKDE